MKNIVLLFLCVFGYGMLSAQAPEAKDMASKPIPEAKVSTTNQQVQINGKTIDLKAQAGTFQIRGEDNKPIANFGFTAYFKKNPAFFLITVDLDLLLFGYTWE